MEIAIHLGAHCTDGDRLLRTLGDNRPALLERGVAVPLPGRARPAIRKGIQAMEGGDLEAVQADLFDTLLGDADADRIVLSYEGFLGAYARVLHGGRLYAEAGMRAGLLQRLFAGHEVTFHMGIRNPATWVPAVYEASTMEDFAAFAAEAAPDAMRWIPPLSDIAATGAPLTVWCNEDLPLVWPEVLHGVAGSEAALRGEDAILREIMDAAGFARLQGYMRDNPPPSAAHWRRVATAFLAKYAREEETIEEIDQPGWTEEIVARLTAAYEAELPEVEAIQGVRFLQP
ncbi:hypothetical protein JQC91_15535 [Jannaschia sp. Os4]|uniref:hypothetical protein n=1 Tax=Jannaschia sp. Os4 TaxID=2807617 RepID=UPI00193A153B|nr:hypothetical protein [Jannaschia sp. Os4]MBM2577719.1 hypothetical protein [Jannaschia sp. Os4]